MNRKGFTLIELLAVIALTAVVGGIATYSIISTINNSKLKSEKVFVDKLSNLIDDYLDLYPPTKEIGDTYTFTKCKEGSCTDSYTVTSIRMVKESNARFIYSDEIIKISDLVNEKIVTYDDLINPKNKEQCFDDNIYDPEIIVYKDSDYVYHYYVDLTENNCNINKENSLIDNMPQNLVEVLNNKNVILPDKLKEKYNLQ